MKLTDEVVSRCALLFLPAFVGWLLFVSLFGLVSRIFSSIVISDPKYQVSWWWCGVVVSWLSLGWLAGFVVVGWSGCRCVVLVSFWLFVCLLRVGGLFACLVGVCGVLVRCVLVVFCVFGGLCGALFDGRSCCARWYGFLSIIFPLSLSSFPFKPFA
ncbi:unnamed protein product [Polarella glacialis]|uniref:Transmembrane protein n=1 Tax=Polarella glacialis TaxID=89957 RepID=A0A813JF27_POLGL|nr:unnamed protein product [Polarella glacialis]CAE8673334.1 unnamed protein product [Polarella glacialis]